MLTSQNILIKFIKTKLLVGTHGSWVPNKLAGWMCVDSCVDVVIAVTQIVKCYANWNILSYRFMLSVCGVPSFQSQFARNIPATTESECVWCMMQCEYIRRWVDQSRNTSSRNCHLSVATFQFIFNQTSQVDSRKMFRFNNDIASPTYAHCCCE